MKKILLVAMLLAFGVSKAQDSLKNFQLESVTITAVRADEKVPISETTLSKRQLETIDIGQDAALHLERLSPSIISYSDAGTSFGNYQNFRLRGMDQSRINVTLNGVPLNDMLDQGVFFSNFVDFSNSIESVQVQRGVGTSTNGTSSYAGSINYESMNLQSDKASGRLGISTGSFSSFGLSAEAQTGKSDNDFSAYVRASRLTSQGYKYYSGSDANSFFLSGGYMGTKHQLKITAFAGKTQNDQAYLPVLKSDIDRDPKTNYNSPNDTDDFEQEMIQLQYNYLLRSDLLFDANIYYSGARGFFPFDIGSSTQFNYGLRNNQYGILANMHKYGDDWELHAGIHAYTFDRDNETNISPNFSMPFYRDNSNKDEISAFIKGEKSFGKLTVYADAQIRNVFMSFESDSLEVYAGDKIAERNYTFLNPKFGLTYQIDSKNDVYVSFGRTGREPTRTDIFSGAGDAVYAFNAASIANSDSIKAEYVNDFEFGFRKTSEKLRLKINGFFMAFENEISAVGGLAQNTYFAIRKNVESSQRYGLELSADYQISNGLSIGLMTTYLETNVSEFNNGFEKAENVEHVFAPNWMVQPNLEYTYREDFSIGVSARYLSESYMELFNNASYIIPESTVLNAYTAYNVSNNIRVAFFVNNIMDELYFTDGAPVDSDFDGSPEGPGYRVQAPRNFFAKLEIKF